MKLTPLIFALLLTACGGSAPTVNLNIGSIAPTFQTFRSDGGATHFPAAFFGKPLVIRFWADWCKYCEGEMKAIESVYQRHKGCLLYTSPSPRDGLLSRMPSSA